MFRTRKFVSRKKPWAAELMQDKPINKTIMKKIFLLFSLLLGVLSVWAAEFEEVKEDEDKNTVTPLLEEK